MKRIIVLIAAIGLGACKPNQGLITTSQAPQQAPGSVSKAPDKEESTVAKVDATKVDVNWMTLDEAVKKADAEKRPIFIDVYTDWCGWCKVMDRETFNDPVVAKLLNDKFYPVKFNAEQTADVKFKGHVFKFVPSGDRGYHQLAAALLNNQLSYPTVVFLNENFDMLQPLPGYRKAPEFHMMAQFIGEGHYKTEKWNEWQSHYKSPYGSQRNEP
ncbi:thioredoxin family protein [Chryseolinea soli]|uniref:DUF255 domain-containing protein n=1 Tax=Chryseolinea soli TaxID=2321403 RepID=A0A385STM8_9BACT|nr:DUF255 domain-containing protein [Chryseolinea soli]AYB35203.1 DUF255 domain-containing protein [Chryseolinea soli]